MTDDPSPALDWNPWTPGEAAISTAPKVASLADTGRPAILISRENTPVGGLAVRDHGSPVHPNHRLLEYQGPSSIDGIPEAAFRYLRDAAGSGLVICWDAMDTRGIRSLENAGFRPGAQPYFELGGGAVEFVMGYTDPTGSVLELILD